MNSQSELSSPLVGPIANTRIHLSLSRRVVRCRWRRWRNHWASIKCPMAGTPSTGLILIFVLNSSNNSSNNRNNSNRHRAKSLPRTRVTRTATHIHIFTATIRTNTKHLRRGRDGALRASSWVKVRPSISHKYRLPWLIIFQVACGPIRLNSHRLVY